LRTSYRRPDNEGPALSRGSLLEAESSVISVNVGEAGMSLYNEQTSHSDNIDNYSELS
jgi:hypothetical protein